MFALFAILCAWAAPDVDSPVKTGATANGDAAVVIGIEDYFMLPDVPHADRDATAFRSFLRYTRGVPEARLRSLGAGANREQILAAVSELAPTVPADGVLWVYFAGHGAADPTSGDRVLLGADTQADQATFQARAVKLSELQDLAANGKGTALFVLDTCYSGRTRGGGDLVEGKRFAVPSYAVAAKSRTIEWTAAGPGEWSGPYDSAEHGAFTYAVLGALRGWADGQISGTPDGKVTVDEAHAYVTETLQALSITDQHPTVLGDPTLVLSTATESPPSFDEDSDANDEASGTVIQGDPSLPGQLQVQSSAMVMFVLDGQPLLPACEGCMQLNAYGLSAGSHRLEVRSAFGKLIAEEAVEIAGGLQLRMHYSKKKLTEVGTGPAVQVPEQTAAPQPGPAPSTANAQNAGYAPTPPTTGDAWFANLVTTVDQEGFADRKVQAVLGATDHHGITIAQLTVLIGKINYSDDRMALLNGVAHAVVDPQNVSRLISALSFTDERELARQLFGR